MKKRVHKMRRAIALQRSLYLLIVICWVLPLTATVLLFNATLEKNVRSRMEDTIAASVENAGVILRERLQESMSDSRAASYDGIIRAAYDAYELDGNGVSLYRASNKYLLSQYSYNTLFDAAFLVFSEASDLPIFVSSQNLQEKSAVVRQMREFARLYAPMFQEELDTDIAFCSYAGRLYMIRNLVTARFEPYASLIMCCNTDYLLESAANIVWVSDASVELDGLTLSVLGQPPEMETEGMTYDAHSRTFFIRETIRLADHTAVLTAVVSGDILAQELDSFHMTLYAVVMISGLLFALIVTFFYKHISRPIAELEVATAHLERGELGYQVDFVPGNREFRDLTARFNTLSERLRVLFDRSIHEQQALHDARIKALQSQINPHFLNNTLEMINWQARMEGSESVSRMIEALSVMLGAAMGRDGRAMVSMKEEFSYIEAYLYIISQRFGDRLLVRKDIDERVWTAQVPRLILQPIVENAIEHGIALRPRGELLLHLYECGGSLILDVEHDGQLLEKDRQAIDRLLGWDGTGPIPPGVARIGIRNVNQRLKMLYGPDSGLTVTEPEPGRVRSRIQLPFLEYPVEPAADC